MKQIFAGLAPVGSQLAGYLVRGLAGKPTEAITVALGLPLCFIARYCDGATGRFFQDRYRATRWVDEASLLACAAYVDLNPIRAAITPTLEASNYTSVQRRIEALGQPSAESANEQFPSSDAFLSPLTIDEQVDPVGPCVTEKVSGTVYYVIPFPRTSVVVAKPYNVNRNKSLKDLTENRSEP